MKSQIFLHIEIVPIRYEWGEVKKVPGNKILLRSILEQCEQESNESKEVFWNNSIAQVFEEFSLCKIMTGQVEKHQPTENCLD